MRRTVLVLGGARSGKSTFAESLAIGHKGSKFYVATSEIIDEEMRRRVELHVAQRGEGWRTIEAPLDLSGALAEASGDTSFVLVECLTIWINNLLYCDKNVEHELFRFRDVLRMIKGTVVLVSNEVGLGIVPENPLARRFRDEAGRANQAIAQIADEVYLVAAGLPLALKKPKPSRLRARREASSRGRRA
jgi:adenosylcobinamide kinase/adenosylcobinamide-phosphate guanylyltransferase